MYISIGSFILFLMNGYMEGISSSETWLCFIHLYVPVPRTYINIQDIHIHMYTYIPSA